MCRVNTSVILDGNFVHERADAGGQALGASYLPLVLAMMQLQLHSSR